MWDCGRVSEDGGLLLVIGSLLWLDRRSEKFWRDAWCDETPLSDSFPSLIAIAKARNA